MGVKRKGNLLDVGTVIPSGSEMIFDKSYPNEIKERYRDNELTESSKLLKKKKEGNNNE